MPSLYKNFINSLEESQSSSYETAIEHYKGQIQMLSFSQLSLKDQKEAFALLMKYSIKKRCMLPGVKVLFLLLKQQNDSSCFAWMDLFTNAIQ